MPSGFPRLMNAAITATADHTLDTRASGFSALRRTPALERPLAVAVVGLLDGSWPERLYDAHDSCHGGPRAGARSESFEFFPRVRRRVRRPTMVDLCAGHGLVGLIFALCEPSVTRVELVDARQPASFERIWTAFTAIAPWVAEKVSYREAALDESLRLPTEAGVVLAHACGGLTDLGLDCAIASGGLVAAMPCCYGTARGPRMPALSKSFGRSANIDITRSCRLADAGYQVDWTHIPQAITTMNRVLAGWDRQPPRPSPAGGVGSQDPHPVD